MGIVNVWGYVWSCLSAYAALGIAWYLLDRRYGIHVYRWFYDLFNTDPMPTHIVRGFMYNQPTNRKVTIAFLFSTAQSLYMMWNAEMNFLVELIMWVLEVPAMLIGFGAGSWVQRLLVRRSEIFNRFDEFSDGVKAMDATQVKGTVEGRVRRVGDSVAGLPAKLLARFWDIVYPVPKPATNIPVPEKKVEAVQQPAETVTPISGRKAFDRYTRRSQ